MPSIEKNLLLKYEHKSTYNSFEDRMIIQNETQLFVV